MLVDGSSNAALIRAIFEIAAWLKVVMDSDNGWMRATMRVVLTILLKTSSGRMSAVSPYGLILSDRAKWDSGGANLPTGVLPLSSADEGRILLTLIEEINATLSMGLDPAPNVHPEPGRERTATLFLVADRIADALERTGQPVMRATIPGWRCIKL